MISVLNNLQCTSSVATAKTEITFLFMDIHSSGDYCMATKTQECFLLSFFLLHDTAMETRILHISITLGCPEGIPESMEHEMKWMEMEWNGVAVMYMHIL